jgi:hypothetical protein
MSRAHRDGERNLGRPWVAGIDHTDRACSTKARQTVSQELGRPSTPTAETAGLDVRPADKGLRSALILKRISVVEVGGKQ